MNIKHAEFMIKELNQSFQRQSANLINIVVRDQLLKIKNKNNYSKIEFISGNGTWTYTVWKGSKKFEPWDEEVFEELEDTTRALKDFLSFMAGEYELYASDCTID